MRPLYKVKMYDTCASSRLPPGKLALIVLSPISTIRIILISATPSPCLMHRGMGDEAFRCVRNCTHTFCQLMQFSLLFVMILHAKIITFFFYSKKIHPFAEI